jgi:hypothetical protein
MNPNNYKNKYGEETPGRFYIVAPEGEPIFQIPLWVEKYFLKEIKSKKFRIHKKVVKKQVIEAIKRGINYNKDS